MSLKLPWPVTRKAPAGRSFTLPELLVAMAIAVILLILLITMTSQISRLWQQSESQKSRQQSARILLQMIERDMSAACFPFDIRQTTSNSIKFVINPVQELSNPDSAFWIAPTSGNTEPGDLYELGYFIQWKGTQSALCRYSYSPTNADSILRSPTNVWPIAANIAARAPGLNDTVNYQGLVAENVIGLWITLNPTNSFQGVFDSSLVTNRPVSVDVGLVIIDSSTAARITSASMVTNLYSLPTIEQFYAALPASLRSGTQMYKTSVLFQAIH